MTLPDSGTVRDYGLVLCGAIAVLALAYMAGTSGPAPTVWREYATAQEKVVAFREGQIRDMTARCEQQLQAVGSQAAGRLADATRLLNNLVKVVEGESDQEMDEALGQAKGRLMDWGVIPMAQ